MQSKILLLVMALFFLCGCFPQEKVTVYVDCCNGESVKSELSFLRGDKKILTFHSEFQIGFMKFLQKSPEGNYFRATFETAESGDYKPFLLDLTGDGDKRYLILAEYLGGNDAFSYRGYLIDTKDNFAIIGEVPAGEICDYPTENKEFIFTLSDSIAYFGARGYATVSVDLKLVKGKVPELIPAKLEKFSLEPYRKLLNEKYNDPCDIALLTLYGDLASRGELSKAAEYAWQLGVPAKEAGKVYSDCLAAIKRSRLRKYLEQLNGMKF